MTRNNKIVLLVILVIFAFTLWVLLPVDSSRLGRDGLRLGLDLKGGVQLIYQADFSGNNTEDRQAYMDRAVLTIEKRIDQFGVTEPVVQQLGNDRIMVQLPGFTDIAAARSLVEQVGFLEFREVEKNSSGGMVYLKDYLSQDQLQYIDTAETGNRVFVTQGTDDNGDYAYKTIAFVSNIDGVITLTDGAGNPTDNVSLKTYGASESWIVTRGDDGTALTGSLLADAQPNINQTSSKPEIDIKWNTEGATIFDQIAARLHNPAGAGGTYSYQYALGIFLDDNLLSAPQLTSEKYEGRGTISGSFTLAKAEQLANLLKSGSLPMALKAPEMQEKISATLGAEFITLSWKAGLIALILVMGFMVAYYRLPGLMASMALVFYTTLTLAVCKLWPITLSLGSIGGIIVGVGIAVDANVLIFERMKEEFRAGRTLKAAIEAGFHRAWSAIWDSNMTTFIACIILYWLGSTAMHNAAVIGFAVTLFLGAVVSMFTAVLVTRTLLRALTGTGLANKTRLFTVTGGKK
ncbi:MAG: protein translocase subunit SecD [Dehalococcoidales bacterium]|jgi:preprotein translocase subunit SecD